MSTDPTTSHGASRPRPMAIPLKDIETALMFAIVRLKTRRAPSEKRHGRTAAYTQAPYWMPTCADMERCRRLDMEARRALPNHFSPMYPGDLARLLERTRLHHGLQEVRRTWGAGMRQLKAEFAGSAVMR